MGPIGVPELIVIFIIALVVFGPKKLPELGKSLGHGLREFNKAKNELKATWDEQLREAERHIDSAKEMVNEPVRDALKTLQAANPLQETTPEATHGANTEASHSGTNAEPPVDPSTHSLT